MELFKPTTYTWSGPTLSVYDYVAYIGVDYTTSILVLFESYTWLFFAHRWKYVEMVIIIRVINSTSGVGYYGDTTFGNFDQQSGQGYNDTFHFNSMC